MHENSKMYIRELTFSKTCNICVLFAVLSTPLHSAKVTDHQQTIRNDDEKVTLRCIYDTPEVEYTRVTIDWRKVNPNNPLFTVTLVTIVDFNVVGVVHPKYSATKEGSLTIEGPFTDGDVGKYSCLVVFRLKEPIDDTGYISEHCYVSLNVINKISLYAKAFGQSSASASQISIQNKPSIFVCNASSVYRNTEIRWSIVNGNEFEDEPNYMIINSEEEISGGRMDLISELTLLPDLDMTETQDLHISCDAEDDDMNFSDNASIQVEIKPSSGKKKRDKSRKTNKRRRQRGKKSRRC
ncbi:uncharacterized protein [Ptychodera flava]|uniref:uncharacterized protein n=1 Tax=Ptychodera flava TaxID=63121 RepID=UPI003969DCB0